MSEENVELARRYLETFNAGGLDAAERFWHPEIEVYDPPTWPDAGRYAGRAAVRQVIETYIELGWDGQLRDPEYFDAGDEALVVWQARGQTAHGSGFPMDQTIAHLVLYEEGRVRRIRQYFSRAEGLEAAGLEE
jgi:ketosteroid isomerase-like protein